MQDIKAVSDLPGMIGLLPFKTSITGSVDEWNVTRRFLIVSKLSSALGGGLFIYYTIGIEKFRLN